MVAPFRFCSSVSGIARLARNAAVAALLCTPAIAPAQRGNPVMEYQGKSIDQLISEFMREHQAPGMVLAIVQAPYIPRITGFGLSDIEHKLLCSSNTVFNIGDMAEAYTGVAIMQLAEAGKLKLEDPIGKHLEGLPDAWKPIPVSRILLHASGIPDYSEAPGFAQAKTAKDLIALVSKLPLGFEPGSNAKHSATDDLLLQLLVEKASGESYQQFVRKGQFERVGLQHTFFASELDSIQQEPVDASGRHAQFLKNPVLINPTQVATGYTLEGDQLTAVPRSRNTSLPWSTEIYASASDISVWDIGLAGEILIKDPELRKVLYQPKTLKGGQSILSSGAWTFTDHPGFMMVSGSGSGFSSFLSRFTDPKELVCVTLLTNKEGLDLAPLAQQIAGAYDPKLGPKQ